MVTYRTCLNCGDVLSEKKERRNAKFCSDNCYKKHFRQAVLSKNPDPDMPTATRGILSELKVISYLLENKMDVFHAVSSSCSCDIAVLKNNKLYKVEVRTGYYLPSGKTTFPKPDLSKSDIIAVAYKDKIAFYHLDSQELKEIDFIHEAQ